MHIKTQEITNFIFLVLVGLTFAACSKNEHQEVLNSGIEQGYPGIIVGIQEGNNKPWIGSKGLANLEDQTSMHADDRFHIASVTKLFTSVAVLKLIDEGRLSLQGPVDSLLPNSLVGEIPYINEIKVHHLLDHSSGIYSFNNDLRYVNTYIGSKAGEGINWTPEQLIELAHTGDAEPQGKPGSGHYYSDANIILLGLIIENVSGVSFRQYLRNNIFDPLELRNTGFYSSQTDTARIEVSPTVQGYLKDSEIIHSFIELPSIFEPANDSLINTTQAVEKIDASAGMVSTAADLLKLGEAVFVGDFLSEESKNWLLSIGDNIENEDQGTVRQGIVTVHHKPYGVLYTSLGDGPGGINSMLAYHPKTELLVVAFTNVFGNFDEHDFFMNELVQSVVNTKSSDR